MHDPKEVLAVCEKAPDGPYHVGGAEGSMPHSHSTQLTGHRPDGNHYVMAQANYNFKEESEALINFIALARTVLPEFARRVIELEGEVDPYWMNKAQELETENAKLRAVAEIALLYVIAEVSGIKGDRHALFAELWRTLTAAGYGGEE